MLLVPWYIPEGRTGEAWEIFKKTALFRKSGGKEKKSITEE
jgi:hypothetical protein